MSGSVLEASNYWTFVQDVVDTQVWKPIQDRLDSHLNRIVQRTEETQKRIETTTLSDLLSRIYCGDDTQSASFSSIGSLSSDSSSPSDSSSISTHNFEDSESDVNTSTTSTDTTASNITVLTENDIVPSPNGNDNRYESEKPLRSWKKMHAVYLNRRRRRSCDVSRPGSEASSTSSDEWCSLQESMEKQGLLRGPFEMDFVKPQYENAYIRNTRDSDEEAEHTSKTKKKIDLSKLIAEYDRQNTSFLIKIPTDMTPRITPTQVDYSGKQKRSKPTSESSEKNVVNPSVTMKTYRKRSALGEGDENTKLAAGQHSINEPLERPKLDLKKFIKAKPFVPSNARQQVMQVSEIQPEMGHFEATEHRPNLINNQCLPENDLQRTVNNTIKPVEYEMCCKELHENLQHKTKLTAMAKVFIPRNAPSDVTSECAEAAPSTQANGNPPTNMRQEPRLSEIFGNTDGYNEVTEKVINTEKDICQSHHCEAPTNQVPVADCGTNQAQNFVDGLSKKCGTLGQTITDHTQPLPRIGIQPCPNTNLPQNVSSIHPACRGTHPTMQHQYPQREPHRIRYFNPVLDDPITGHHYIPSHYELYIEGNNKDYMNAQQGCPQLSSYMQALTQYQLQQMVHQRAANGARIQDLNALYSQQQRQQLVYQMVAAGVPETVAYHNVEKMTAHAQLQYEQQVANGMATAQQVLQTPQTEHRQQPSMMERFRSPSMVTEFVPRHK